MIGWSGLACALGQRVNHAKSSFHFSKGCPADVRDQIKEALQVPNES